MAEFSFSLAPESEVKVIVKEGILKACGPRIAESVMGRKALVVTHPVVAELFLESLQDSLEQAGFAAHAMCLPEGESSKDWDSLTDIFGELRLYGFDRSDVVISLGGGVAGDIATVAAGLYMRGINLVHVPTTLLAQVDSCLGGKGAVNFGSGKNMLGLFYQPRLVIVDPELLSTLPDEQMAAGYAEVVKCALLNEDVCLALGAWRLGEDEPAGGEGERRLALGAWRLVEDRPPGGERRLALGAWRLVEDELAGGRGDGRLALGAWRLGDEPPGSTRDGHLSEETHAFEQRSQLAKADASPGPDYQALSAKRQAHIITSCLRFKASVVASDPLDAGVRQQLNLGHTFGHALEAVGGFAEYNHGQAVGLGLLAALRLSELRYGLDRKVEDEVRRLLSDLGLPTCTPYGYDDLQPYFKADKKSEGGKPRFVGLREVGDYAMIEDATKDELRQALAAIFCAPV